MAALVGAMRRAHKQTRSADWVQQVARLPASSSATTTTTATITAGAANAMVEGTVDGQNASASSVAPTGPKANGVSDWANPSLQAVWSGRTDRAHKAMHK